MLSAWRRWFAGAPASDASRWVVVDVETSGLDAANDRLLAIAAVALDLRQGRPRVALADSFEVVLRQSEAPADKANILLHGIGVSAQGEGVDPALALQAFEAFVGQSPLLAFHSAFDEQMIGRAFAQFLGRPLRAAWVDLAAVAAVLHPQAKAQALDEWMTLFDIHCAQRHQAAADTFATAELMLKLWPALERQSRRVDFKAVQRMALQRRWLSS